MKNKFCGYDIEVKKRAEGQVSVTIYDTEEKTSDAVFQADLEALNEWAVFLWVVNDLIVDRKTFQQTLLDSEGEL